MAKTARADGSAVQLEDVAWQFLRSEFASTTYTIWPIDRRLDAFLRRRGYRELHDDGSAYNALLDRVMASIVRALRDGVLPTVTAQVRS